MSFWVELHCDVRREGNRPDDILRSICLTSNNDNPAGMARTASSVPAIVKFITDGAEVDGWRKISGRWICPGCWKYQSHNSCSNLEQQETT